jgi:hypothetical protein
MFQISPRSNLEEEVCCDSHLWSQAGIELWVLLRLHLSVMSPHGMLLFLYSRIYHYSQATCS